MVTSYVGHPSASFPLASELQDTLVILHLEELDSHQLSFKSPEVSIWTHLNVHVVLTCSRNLLADSTLQQVAETQNLVTD